MKGEDKRAGAGPGGEAALQVLGVDFFAKVFAKGLDVSALFGGGVEEKEEVVVVFVVDASEIDGSCQVVAILIPGVE